MTRLGVQPGPPRALTTVPILLAVLDLMIAWVFRFILLVGRKMTPMSFVTWLWRLVS